MGNDKEEASNTISPTTSLADLFAIIEYINSEYKKKDDGLEKKTDITQQSIAEMRAPIERLSDFLSRPRRQATSKSLQPKYYLQAILHSDGTPMDYEADQFIIQCHHVEEYIPSYSENEILILLMGYVRGLQPKYLIHFTTKSFIDLASALAVGRRVEQELSEILQLYFDNCFERKDHLEGREATRPQRFHPESFT
ncbi:hypothetical protein PV325_004978, partial [Microctonus aethiopoides]